MKNIAPDDLEADDRWIDLERSKPAAGLPLPEVQVRCSHWGRKDRAPAAARAVITFRRDAAEWILQFARFKIQIGGVAANKIKLVPDNERGNFSVIEFKGIARLNLSIVSAWPNEQRDPTAAKYALRDGAMVLELPVDFAQRRTVEPQPEPPKAAPAGPSVSRQYPPDNPYAKPKHNFGDPPVGRSALDQKRGVK